MNLRVAGLILGIFIATASYADDETVELKVIKMKEMSGMSGPICTLTSSLTNKTSKSFESFAPKVQVYDADGYLIATAKLLFSNTRPGKTSTWEEHVENATCDEIQKVVVENIEYCKHSGEYWNGCERYLKLLDGVKPLEM